MIDSIRRLILASLVDNSQLGPRGVDVDLSSLSLAGLALRVDEYGLKFGKEETQKLAGPTVGAFCPLVAERTQARTLVE